VDGLKCSEFFCKYNLNSQTHSKFGKVINAKCGFTWLISQEIEKVLHNGVETTFWDLSYQKCRNLFKAKYHCLETSLRAKIKSFCQFVHLNIFKIPIFYSYSSEYHSENKGLECINTSINFYQLWLKCKQESWSLIWFKF